MPGVVKMYETMWKKKMVMHTLIACGVGSAAMMAAMSGCAPQDDTEQDAATSTEALCQQAQAHVSACFPDEEIAAQTSCTSESASALLAESCDDLARKSASAKADGSCNPLFFWRSCNKGLQISMVSACFEGQCDWSDTRGIPVSNECFQYEVRDAQGNIVAGDRVRGGQALMREDLPDGVYSIAVIRRDGSDAEFLVDASNVDAFNSLSGMKNKEVLVPAFKVEGGKRDRHELYLVFDGDEMGTLRRCGTLTPKVQMICNGEVQQNTRGKYDWYMTIEPVSASAHVNEEGNRHAPYYALRSTTESYLAERYNETMDLDVWRKDTSVYQVDAGEYDVTFHRVELPEDVLDRIENSYDFVDPYGDELIELLTTSKYAIDYEVTHRVTVDAEEDFAGHFGIGLEPIDLDYGPTSCE